MHGQFKKLGKFTASKSYPCILVGKLNAMVDPHQVRNGNLWWDNQGLFRSMLLDFSFSFLVTEWATLQSPGMQLLFMWDVSVEIT